MKKISLINGAGNGANTYNAGQTVMDITADTYSGITGFESQIKNMPSIGNTIKTYDGSVVEKTGWQWGLPFYTSVSSSTTPTLGINKTNF